MFCVFDENDSGNISFGFDDGQERHFVKVAGLETIEFKGDPKDAVRSLKRAMPAYVELRHPNLIELEDHYQLDGIYVAVFKWSEGDCLFDHWNFEKYSKDPTIVPPYQKFKQLPLEKRLRAFDVVLSFFETVARKKYVAVDFYDGSIMYDFETDRTTICDMTAATRSGRRVETCSTSQLRQRTRTGQSVIRASPSLRTAGDKQCLSQSKPRGVSLIRRRHVRSSGS